MCDKVGLLATVVAPSRRHHGLAAKVRTRGPPHRDRSRTVIAMVHLPVFVGRMLVRGPGSV
jgi:hypothetical protein